MARYNDDNDYGSDDEAMARGHYNENRPMTGQSRDTRQIGAQLTQNREELLKLRELIGMLSDRIMPVLGPERSEKSLTPSDDSPECSDIARELDDHRALIRSAQRHVSGLLDRIEL